MTNDDAFTQLLNATFRVPLYRYEGVSLLVRRMPFMTMAAVLTRASAELQGELSNVLRLFSERNDNQALVAENETNIEFGIRVLGALIPSIAQVTATSETLLKRVLADVIVDVTPRVLDALSVEDTTAVLNAVLNDMDKTVIAKQVAELFFGIAEVGKAIVIHKPISETSKTKDV